MMNHFCHCHNYVDEPIYRLPYDVYFGSEKDLNENFDNNGHTMCQIEGVDSFLYLEQDKNITNEITIKKSYSKFWKEGVYSFLDNFIAGDKNVIFLYYSNRENKIIYKVKIYDIEKFNVNYFKMKGSGDCILLDLEIKFSNFKQSYKFITKK